MSSENFPIHYRFLLEEYKERHAYLRFLATRQGHMAVALMTLNGFAIFRSSVDITFLLSLLMLMVGVFGIAHNNRILLRYDKGRVRLAKIAKKLEIEGYVHGNLPSRLSLSSMGFWFYFLYGSLAGYWLLQVLLSLVPTIGFLLSWIGSTFSNIITINIPWFYFLFLIIK